MSGSLDLYPQELGASRLNDSRAVVEGLFLLMRTMTSHGPTHPLTAQAAESLRQSILLAQPPYSLQFVGQAVFRDRALVPFDVAGFLRTQQVALALSNLGAHEITFEGEPTIDHVFSFGQALSKGSASRSPALHDIKIPTMKWREIPGAKWGEEAEDVDTEVFTAAQVALAIGEAETLAAERERPWNWAAGMSVLRRLDRSMRASRAASARALEIAPGRWSVARRAVAACFHVASVLEDLEVTVSTKRAASHAALALGCAGYDEREGEELADVAPRALARMFDAPVLAKSGVEPHRVRVCSVVYFFASAAQEEGAALDRGVLPLLQVSYELERRRCPKKVVFDLTLADLLAQAAESWGKRFDPRWIAAIVRASGLVPPGAYVRLADGRTGIVLGAEEGGDPLCPVVLVGNRVVTAVQPVELLSPVGLGVKGR